jgi:hypothetical protein
MRGYVTVAVVVFLVLMLACLLLPALSRVHGPSMRIQCEYNLKQIVLAAHNYHDMNRCFPRGTVRNEALPADERLSWMVTLLPYLEEDRVYKSMDLEAGWQAGKNSTAMNSPLKLFRCPASAGARSATPSR